MQELFISLIYQPFFNILVAFYLLLDKVTGGEPDMGIAVILLTILIRIILLPLSFASESSEDERRQISAQVKEIEERYATDPIMREKSKRKLLHGNRRIILSEVAMLIVQVTIALMLWKIFATGLGGEDVHLIYGFMPDIDLPFNLVFLDRFDLTHTSFVLNLIQSLSIFAVETLALLSSPYPTTRAEAVRLQLVLPIVSFLVFMALPAGKKLFVITTLWFSFIWMLVRYIRLRFLQYVHKQEEAQSNPEPPIVQTIE